MHIPKLKSERFISSRSWHQVRRALSAASVAGTAVFGATSASAAQTTAHWSTAVSANWTDTTDWSIHPLFPNNGTPVGATYQAIIDATGTAYTVTLNSTVAVDSLFLASADATLNQTSGSLTLTTATLSAGKYTLSGGTLSGGAGGGTLNLSGGALQITSGTLDHMSITGSDLNLDQFQAALTVTNGITVASGKINMTGGLSSISFIGSQSLSNLAIRMAGISGGNTGFFSAIHTSNAVADVLTVASTSSVKGYGSISGTGALVNNGTIAADTAATTLTVNPTSFTNNATASASNGGTLSISSTNWSNTSAISVDGTSTLNFAGAWSNSGSVTGTLGGTINLGGTFTTAGIGNFTSNGATVNLTGTLNNNSATLNLDSTSGSWNLSSNGTINGGTIAFNSPQTLHILSGTLSGVSITGSDLNLDQFQAALTVTNGITVASGKINMTGGLSSISFIGSQSLSNLAIRMAGISGGNTGFFSAIHTSNAVADVLTVASTSSVKGYGSISGTGALVNNGTIAADTAATTLTVNPTSFTNNATASASNGGTLSISSTNWSNTSAISVDGTSTLNFAGAWSNSGSVTGTLGGTINLGGTFTTAGIGNFTSNGATVNLTGTLNNNSATLNLDSTSGSWNLSSNGTINGGTIAFNSPQTLHILSGTLSGVSITGSDLNLDQFQAALTVTNGITVASGKINMTGGLSSISFIGSQSLSNLAIRMAGISGGNTGFFSAIHTSNAVADVLTVASTSSVKGYGSISGTGALVNNGTIAADTAATTLTVNPTSFTNNATASASNGGTLSISSTNWSNTSAISVDGTSTLNFAGAWSNSGSVTGTLGGTINLGGTFTTAGIGNFTSNGATVNLTGTLNNNSATLNLDSTSGSWNLSSNGTINGGTIAFNSPQTLHILSGTLSGVSITGSDLNLDQFQAALTVTNGITVASGKINMTGGLSSISFIGSQSLSNLAIRMAGISGGNTGFFSAIHTSNAVADVLTVASTSSVKGYGSISGTGALVNNGTIAADTAATTLTVNPTSFTNNATASASNGGTLSISSTNWSNNGTMSGVRLGGGTAVLNTGSTASLASASSNAVTSLTLNGTAKLDLTTGSLAINYGAGHPSPFSTIQSYVLSGRNGGTWDGPGINSSSLDSKHGVGYADISNSVIVRYTIYGDTNLDGSVGFGDLLSLAQHYSGTNTTWQTGDFTYDGKTNFSDLLLLAQNYNTHLSVVQGQQLESLASPTFLEQWGLAQAQEAASVPEPGSLVVAAISAGWILQRRRRRVNN